MTDLQNFEFVVATYANTNELLENHEHLQQEYKFELVEKPS